MPYLNRVRVSICSDERSLWISETSVPPTIQSSLLLIYYSTLNYVSVFLNHSNWVNKLLFQVTGEAISTNSMKTSFLVPCLFMTWLVIEMLCLTPPTSVLYINATRCCSYLLAVPHRICNRFQSKVQHTPHKDDKYYQRGHKSPGYFPVQARSHAQHILDVVVKPVYQSTKESAVLPVVRNVKWNNVGAGDNCSI